MHCKGKGLLSQLLLYYISKTFGYFMEYGFQWFKFISLICASVASFHHQVFNEINSRDIERINVFRGMCSSGVFIGVMVSTVAFQAIIVEFLGTFASTVHLNWQLWSLSILIGAVSMPLAAILKCIPVERKVSPPKHHDGYEALPTGPEQV